MPHPASTSHSEPAESGGWLKAVLFGMLGVGTVGTAVDRVVKPTKPVSNFALSRDLWSGRAGIRTLERLAALPVFKTGARPANRLKILALPPTPRNAWRVAWRPFPRSRPTRRSWRSVGTPCPTH